MWKVSFTKSLPKSAFCVRCSFVQGSEKSALAVFCLFLLCSCSFGAENQTFLQNFTGKKWIASSRNEAWFRVWQHSEGNCLGNERNAVWGPEPREASDCDSEVTCSAGEEQGEWMQLYQQLSPLVGYIHKAGFTGEGRIFQCICIYSCNFSWISYVHWGPSFSTGLSNRRGRAAVYAANGG